MIKAALILGAATAILELSLVWRFAAIRNIIERVPMLGLGFSVILALSLGHIFSARGVIVMTAAIIGIVFTTPIYFLWAKFVQWRNRV
jgi:putative flippase GtrA